VELLLWIENSGVAEMIRVSAYGYPIMIMLHSLGLAIMVGLSVVLSLRVLGFFGALPYQTLGKQLKVAWIGFIVNFISGGLLFSAQATTYITDFEFILKMSFVIIGAVLVGVMQGQVRKGSASWTVSKPPPAFTRILATLSIIAWTGGMITGRLIAYL
jgi:hypothetical protein